MRRLGLVVCLSILSVPVEARVVSYSPVTNGAAVPAVQMRTNRHYVLIEAEDPRACPNGSDAARLVVYDSTGAEPPRAVFPPGGRAFILSAAAFEDETGLRLVLETNADVGGGPPGLRTLYSSDGGSTWQRLSRPRGLFYLETIAYDISSNAIVSSMTTLFNGLGFHQTFPTSLSSTEVVMSE